MTKLLVLDKDGTLTRPKSGNTFVQNPEDQELIEGVAEAIARYVADGWTLAIASNQGGCHKISSEAQYIPIGAYIEVGGIAERCEYLGDKGEDILFNGYYLIPKTTLIKYQYKSIDMAIAEMQYALQLTGIDIAFFCSDMEGITSWGCSKVSSWEESTK